MSNESIPPRPSPEQPPLAPHDPPDPAPQAAAWLRALRVVVTRAPGDGGSPVARAAARAARTNKRGRALVKIHKNQIHKSH
jgi:hypothetical protein